MTWIPFLFTYTVIVIVYTFTLRLLCHKLHRFSRCCIKNRLLFVAFLSLLPLWEPLVYKTDNMIKCMGPCLQFFQMK